MQLVLDRGSNESKLSTHADTICVDQDAGLGRCTNVFLLAAHCLWRRVLREPATATATPTTRKLFDQRVDNDLGIAARHGKRAND